MSIESHFSSWESCSYIRQVEMNSPSLFTAQALIHTHTHTRRIQDVTIPTHAHIQSLVMSASDTSSVEWRKRAFNISSIVRQNKPHTGEEMGMKNKQWIMELFSLSISQS